LRAEDFFYNLDILYGGLGKGKLQFLIKKEEKKFSVVIFFSIFGHLSPGSVLDLDPDPDLGPDPYWSPTSYSGSGSGSVKNEYVSTTLVLIQCKYRKYIHYKGQGGTNMATQSMDCTTALAYYHSNPPRLGHCQITTAIRQRGFGQIAIAAKVLVQSKNL
jgi:hypothetical protein